MTAVVAVAASARLDVVIEGVETRRQLAASLRAGARLVQGFLFAKPMPVAEAGLLLESLAAGRPAPWRALIAPPAIPAGPRLGTWRFGNEVAAPGAIRPC